METQTLAESSKLDNNLNFTETDPDEDEEESNEADDIEDDDDDDDDDSLGDEEEAKGRVFSVGEFVWGKIKHHPWWPGQIYDPSDASDLALKHKPKDKTLYLVAYFGDGTFSWCSAAQLKRFDVNFESLSKQSCLKSFEYAVEDALSVISELVVLEMSCGCVQKDGEVGFVRPVAENAGVRKGVLVPMVGVDGLGVDAAEIVCSVRNAGRSVLVKNSLELSVLSSKLLAFCRAKGYRELPKYHFPVFIEGLEDVSKRSVDVDADAPVDGSVSNEDGQANSSEKARALRDDKLYGRRKQKSLADIIREETDTDMKIDEDDDDDKETPKRRRQTKKPKQAGAGQNVSEKKGSLSSLAKGRQKAKSSQKTNSYEDTKVESVGKAETNSVENTNRSDSVEVDVAVKPKGRKRVAATTMSGEKDGAVKSMDKRRKKESLTPISSIKQAGFEPVLLDLHTDSRVGERMSKAAKLIIESPPIRKHSLNSDSTPTEMHSGVKPAAVSPLHERPKLDVSPLKTASDFDTPMDEDEDDGRPMSAILFMTFSNGVSLPSKTDLLAKYSQFGSLNKEETDVVPNSHCAQVVFIKKSDGEQAFEHMVRMNSAESGVQYRIRYVSRGSKIGKLDGSMQPKSSLQSVKVHNDAHPVSVSYLKRRFETIMFKLNNVEEDELPNELKEELLSELTSLLEELS